MNTATIIVTDRIEGVWDRSVVAGVSVLEIVIVHFITQFLIIMVQSTELLVITFGIMKADYSGSLMTIIILIILQGACGIACGNLSIPTELQTSEAIFFQGSLYLWSAPTTTWLTCFVQESTSPWSYSAVSLIDHQRVELKELMASRFDLAVRSYAKRSSLVLRSYAFYDSCRFCPKRDEERLEHWPSRCLCRNRHRGGMDTHIGNN